MSNEKFAETVWRRNKFKIIEIINVLKAKLRYFERETDDILNFVQYKFLKLCYDFYENDQQFMSYMYVVTKNIIFDLRRKDYKYFRKHISDPNILKNKFLIRIPDDASNKNDNYLKVMNEIAVDKHINSNCHESLVYKELIESVVKLLENPLHVKVFKYILESYKPTEIAELVNRSISYVNTVRKEYVYPAVGAVLGIWGEKYEYASSSGRIYV